jgi:hypothetical protein
MSKKKNALDYMNGGGVQLQDLGFSLTGTVVVRQITVNILTLSHDVMVSIE